MEKQELLQRLQDKLEDFHKIAPRGHRELKIEEVAGFKIGDSFVACCATGQGGSGRKPFLFDKGIEEFIVEWDEYLASCWIKARARYGHHYLLLEELLPIQDGDWDNLPRA